MRRNWIAIAALCVAFCSGPAFALPPGTIIGDSFTTGDGTGTSGGFIPGNSTEIGSATWIGQHLFYSGTNSAIGGFQFGTNTRINHVAFSPASGQAVSLQADVIPPHGGSGQDWTAIAFAKDPASTPDSAIWTPGVSQLYFALQHDGRYFGAYNATNTFVDGIVAGFNPNVFYKIELIYDEANNSVSAKINGNTVLSDYDLGSFVPDINTAGFQFFRWQLHGQYTDLDNFAIVAVVPEPASAGLLLIAAGCFGLIWRKNR
jgi:hypothetical protein